MNIYYEKRINWSLCSARFEEGVLNIINTCGVGCQFGEKMLQQQNQIGNDRPGVTFIIYF